MIYIRFPANEVAQSIPWESADLGDVLLDLIKASERCLVALAHMTCDRRTELVAEAFGTHLSPNPNESMVSKSEVLVVAAWFGLTKVV